MSRSVSMQFGKSGGVVQNSPGIKYISGGDIVDDTTVILEFAPGGIYLLFTTEWTASSGVFRGHRASLITAPEEKVFGTVAVARSSMAASQNAGVSITLNNDSTLSIKQSSTAYNWRYSLYRVG